MVKQLERQRQVHQKATVEQLKHQHNQKTMATKMVRQVVQQHRLNQAQVAIKTIQEMPMVEQQHLHNQKIMVIKTDQQAETAERLLQVNHKRQQL